MVFVLFVGIQPEFLSNLLLVFFLSFSTTYITCPADPKKTLGIKLPFLVMIIKNLKKYFTFEVQVNKTGISCKDIWAKIVRNLLVWEVCVTSSQVLPLLTLQVLDDKNVKRRFRASNYQSTTRVKPFICTMPMRLDDGWNQIQVNYTRVFAWKPLLLACDKLIERTSCQIK